MISNFFLMFFLFGFLLGTPYAFAGVDFLVTDKSAYYEGEMMRVSGTVSTELPVTSVSIVILDPARSSFIAVAPTIANSDGSFSVDIRVGGPLWTTYDSYPVQATSEDVSKETIIDYLESVTPDPTPDPTPVTATFTTLKLQIPNFPAFDKSPQHYIDRYNTESSYKSWFDSQFPNDSIVDVVGYKQNSNGFPAFDKSPQHYIDRYNTESSYKSWFDSQFPNSSIYNVLGYNDPVSVPDWIKDYAEWWAIGDVDDSQFVAGLEFMLENNIIMVSSVSSSGNSPTEDIPDWVRNNAHWWSQNLISETDFINSLEYLIQKGIITIN